MLRYNDFTSLGQSSKGVIVAEDASRPTAHLHVYFFTGIVASSNTLPSQRYEVFDVSAGNE